LGSWPPREIADLSPNLISVRQSHLAATFADLILLRSAKEVGERKFGDKTALFYLRVFANHTAKRSEKPANPKMGCCSLADNTERCAQNQKVTYPDLIRLDTAADAVIPR
jgi:hypothetical protein